MKRGRFTAAAALLAVAIAQPALAQQKTCDDIVFTPEALAQYPDLDKACQGVITRGGQDYVQVIGRVMAVRGRGQHVQIQFKDGGRYWISPREGQMITLLPPGGVPGATAAIGSGQTAIPPSELVRGMELGIYLPTDTWAMQIPEPMTEELVIVEITPVEVVEELEVEVMPTTASPVPLIGLLGGIFLLAGAGLTLLRRRG